MEAERQDHKPGAVVRFLRSSELGATMMEYVILAACIAVVALAGVANVGEETDATFFEVGQALAGANIPDGGEEEGR